MEKGRFMTSILLLQWKKFSLFLTLMSPRDHHMFPKVTFALPAELCAASLQKPDLCAPCPCRTVLLWNHERRNLHIFKVTSLKIYCAFGSLNQREASPTCATTHPHSGIFATLVGKTRLLTPRLSATGWFLLATSLPFLFLARSRLWYPGLVKKIFIFSPTLQFKSTLLSEMSVVLVN